MGFNKLFIEKAVKLAKLMVVVSLFPGEPSKNDYQ